ncbi:MAG: PilZ domain-containing protein [Sneathiella sp.]|nr:PilZ domain-containing protein [Sneathiella sp.]
MNEIPKQDDRRTFHRNSARRVVLIIDGKPFLANNWSPSGFNIDFPESGLSKGDILSGEIDIFEVEEKGQFTATVVRVQENGQIAANFTELSSQSYMNLCITVAISEEEFR